MEISKLKQIAKDHIGNNGTLPNYSVSPKKAIISLKNDRGTSYGAYIAIQNELKAYKRLGGIPEKIATSIETETDINNQKSTLHIFRKCFCDE